jgi:hypothetical protein
MGQLVPLRHGADALLEMDIEGLAATVGLCTLNQVDP